MERKISVSLYLWACFISFIIFAIGVFVGYLLDSSSMNRISGTISDTSDKLSSLELLILMEGNSSSFCPVFSSQLNEIDRQVENSGYELSFLEDQKGASDPDLKKRYFVLEAESYLLSKKVRTLCGDDSILLINFYSNSACTDCKSMGTEILKARDNAVAGGAKVKLFSFDGDLGSPVADAFKNQYNVTSYPSIVVNDQLYPGFKDSAAIEGIIRKV